MVDVEWQVEVAHCGVVEGVVLDATWALERLEQWEVRQVVAKLVTVPVVGMVVVWESSLERFAAVLW